MSTKDNTEEALHVPQDDGACDHLRGKALPSVALPGVSGKTVDLSAQTGTLVAYFYPRIGNPAQPTAPEWADIPGAKGCTPEACGFRDHLTEMHALGARVFGISAQSLEEQKEATDRLKLGFELLSDSDLKLAQALRLPTFEFQGNVLIKRLTLIIEKGKITKVFYPVFPPADHAAEVCSWLEGNR